MDPTYFKNRLFSGPFDDAFALDLFRWQAAHNPVYSEYVKNLGKDIQSVKKIEEIPFLPIQFFKSKRVLSVQSDAPTVFRSSGTTAMDRSQHFVSDLGVYKDSIEHGFRSVYGDPKKYSFHFLLPSYLERTDSSLVYMAKVLQELSAEEGDRFYLNDLDGLIESVKNSDSNRIPFLIGVSFALLELAEKHPSGFENAIVMETGGMKGRGKEVIRKELHSILMQGLNVSQIHGEYGMTELLSQAYALQNGEYCPSTSMKILIRDPEDPFSYVPDGRNGAINVIDLANINSCSFIATDDIGRRHRNGYFEVLGRFDRSDIRGCNLMAL